MIQSKIRESALPTLIDKALLALPGEGRLYRKGDDPGGQLAGLQ